MNTNAAVTASSRDLPMERDDVLPIIEGVLIPRTRLALAALIPCAAATVISAFLHGVSYRGPESWSNPDPATAGVAAGIIAGLLVALYFIGRAWPIVALSTVAALYATGLVHCVTDQTGFSMPYALGHVAVVAVMLYGLTARIKAVRLARATGIDLEELGRDSTK